jgi:hypothetical protein
LWELAWVEYKTVLEGPSGCFGFGQQQGTNAVKFGTLWF